MEFNSRKISEISLSPRAVTKKVGSPVQTSESTISTASMSASDGTKNRQERSHQPLHSSRSAPKKPERAKSGALKLLQRELSLPCIKVGNEPVRRDGNYGRSLNFHGECSWFDNNDNEDSFCDEKWFALNDAEPKTPGSRGRRIDRSFSDSELSEASTINSGCDMDQRERRGRIKARREAVRNRRKEIKKQRQQELHDAAISEVEEAFNNTSEDDELVDTAKDLPGIVNEMALRRKKWREDRKARENNDSLRRSSQRKSPRRQSGPSERRRKSSSTSRERPRRQSSKEGPQRSKSFGGRRSSTNESLSPRSPRLANASPRRTPRRGKKKDIVNDSSLELSASLLSDQPEHYTSEDLWSTKRRSSSRSNSRRARRESKSNDLRLSSHTQGSASSESVWSPSASSKNGFERLLQHSKKEMPLHHPRKIRSMVETINCPIITGSQSPNKVETPALLPRKTQSFVETTKPQRRASSKGRKSSRLSEEVADSAAGVLLDNAKDGSTTEEAHEITRTPLERTDNSSHDLKKRTFLIKSKSARYLTNKEAKQDASVPKSSSAAGSLSAFTHKYDQTVTNTKDMKNHSFFVKSKSARYLSVEVERTTRKPFSESSLSTHMSQLTSNPLSKVVEKEDRISRSCRSWQG